MNQVGLMYYNAVPPSCSVSDDQLEEGDEELKVRQSLPSYHGAGSPRMYFAGHHNGITSQ
jgi:hypothetical protein